MMVRMINVLWLMGFSFKFVEKVFIFSPVLAFTSYFNMIITIRCLQGICLVKIVQAFLFVSWVTRFI